MTTQPLSKSDLAPSEYAPYFQSYLDLAGDGNVHELLADQRTEMLNFFCAISDESAAKIHPPYTWSTIQVLGHIIDTEKIFACRAHRIACGDQTELPGFDQDALVANFDYSETKLQDLSREFVLLRETNQAFFKRLSPASWLLQGSCDQKMISVRAIAMLLVGHANHHLKILQQRLA